MKTEENGCKINFLSVVVLVKCTSSINVNAVLVRVAKRAIIVSQILLKLYKGLTYCLKKAPLKKLNIVNSWIMI